MAARSIRARPTSTITRMRRAVLVAALVFPSVAAADNQVWNAAFVQARNGPTGLTGWLDLHMRRRESSTLAIIRPAIGWTFSPALAVHAGYAFVPSITDEGGNGREHRSWQQVIYNHAAGAAKLQGRARFEQRFGSWDGVGYRIRLLARAQYQPMPDVSFQLVVTDEVFLGLNDVDMGPKSGYDQNRLFLGVGTDTKLKGVRVEGGYMNIHLRGDAPLVHALAVNLIATIAP